MNGWLHKSVPLLVWLLLVQGVVLAYEETTHIEFSEYAADNSVLGNDPALLGNFGLSPYGTREFTNSDGYPNNIQEIIAFGANFEDDGNILNPFDTDRFLRHFFDPQSGNGLLGFATSPDWALERNASQAPLDNSLQAYSYKDARDYFHAAFTCQTSACRLANFSKTFQTIGHVIHHLQDMGQPQHSRLDIHPLAPSNFYERYTQTKDDELVGIINATSYPSPLSGPHYFSLPRHYWQTGDGRGMAEFTGTNYVTMGTNFRRDSNAPSGFVGDPDFPLPDGTGIVQTTKTVTLTGIGGESKPAVIDFLEGGVSDPLINASYNRKLAAISVLDAHLDDSTLGSPNKPTITMNSRVFDDRLPILLPRIAAFSIDFTNYFFRGRIDMVEDSGSNNSWRIVNNSAETMSGQFDLYAESTNGNRTKLTGWNLTLSAGASSAPLTFQPPVTSVSRYVLAFRGQLGNEVDAVAGKVLNNICTQNCADCGVPITPAGGQSNQIQQFIYNVGSQYPQEVSLFFEAYSIPDRLQVYGGNTLLYDTGGLVSGVHTATINYNPNVHGPSLNVLIDAPNAGTWWNFCLDCNSSTSLCGQYNGTYDDPVTIEGRVDAAGTGGCSATAVFSGPTSYSRSISNSGGLDYSFYPKLLPGSYSVALQNISSGCEIGVFVNTVWLGIFLNGQMLTAVDPFTPSSTFYIPARPSGSNDGS